MGNADKARMNKADKTDKSDEAEQADKAYKVVSSRGRGLWDRFSVLDTSSRAERGC